MAYEPKKDMVLKDLGSYELENGHEMSVSLRSYDLAEPKLTLIRRYKKKDGSKGSSGVFRIPQDEWEGLLDHLDDDDPFDLSDLE